MKALTIKQELNLISVAENLPAISERTRDTYRNMMITYHKFCDNSGSTMDLNSLTAWITDSKTPSTQALRTAAARKVFGQVYKGHPQLQELKDAISEIKVVKQDHKITESKYLNSSEIELLVDNSTVKMGVIIRTLFMTGVRISELLSMRFDKCSFIREGQVIEIRVVGKRAKENVVYITSDLFDKIKETFSGKEFLFEHEGETYNRKYVSLMIARAGEKIGKNISAHSIRHSFANSLMEKGVSIDKVSKALAHASVSTTADFYLHSKPSLSELGVI